MPIGQEGECYNNDEGSGHLKKQGMSEGSMHDIVSITLCLKIFLTKQQAGKEREEEIGALYARSSIMSNFINHSDSIKICF